MINGIDLLQSFQTHSAGLKGEVSLFRALLKAFDGLGSDTLAKEYHGTKYQVKFKEGRGKGRPIPRCELCDLLIIHYPEGNPGAARITLNQAKVTSNTFDCSFNKPYRFHANLEQWDLLANRPIIQQATRTFIPPADLLSAALLPSIGTFGVFYPFSGGFNFAYFVADTLKVLNNNSSRSGTLEWCDSMLETRTFDRYEEITGTCCLVTFGDALNAGLIGTPISHLIKDSKNAIQIRLWLEGILNTLRRENRESTLPQELLRGLALGGIEDSSVIHREPSQLIRAVVIVKGRSLSRSA